ncbi:MAG: NUDIX domain-containing protein [Halobacteriales archaeon]|nr:NUDIX domain-containing protein [Halobacteriales archaeon]
MRETAAACIAMRGEGESKEICLVQAGEAWTIPMALLGKGEIPKQTALRALREASGVEAQLGDVDPAWYKTTEQVYRKGIEKVRREVHFYRVRVKPDLAGGQWFKAPDALVKVTSKAAREMLEAALGLAKPPPVSTKPAKPLFEDE